MSNIFHVIKDPVHGTLQFSSLEDNWIKPFIDSSHFQRLRHIKQLGMGDYIFPGAVHTRFNHCLGCCYVASQIAHKIGLVDEERQMVMTACLLHDIGHGPFSHAFEGIFDNKLISHEDWTPYFLTEYATKEFFTHYNKINPRYHLNEEKFHHIEKMIMHKTVEKQVLADIVSSQLDADRLDYLLRDNHFCGVRYGEFDLKWMLHCLAIVESKEGERLGITHKGIGVVEHYLMARRLMTRNIYHSQKKLALEYFLVQLLSTLAACLERDPLFENICNTELGKFLISANQLNQLTKNADNKLIQKHKKHFLEKNFDNYKTFCDYDVFFLIKKLSFLRENHAAILLAKRLQDRIMPKIFRLDHADLQKVEQAIAEFKLTHGHHFQEWQIKLLQTPHRSYSGEDDPILVLNEHGLIKPIGDFSFMLKTIADKFEHTAFLCIDSLIMDNKIVQRFIAHLEKIRGVELS